VKGLESLKPLQEKAEALGLRVRGFLRPFEKILFVSLLDGVLVPRKGISVTVARGRLSILGGSRFLARIRAGEEKVYTFEDGRMVQPENVASTVTLAMEELKIRSADVTLVMPREWVAVRTLSLPSTVRDVVGNVIRVEFDRFMPFPATEALYDYRVTGEEDGKIHLSLAAVKMSVMAPYLDALKAKGIAVSRITVGPSALGTLGLFATGCPDLVCAALTETGYTGCTVMAGVPASFFGKNLPVGRDNDVSAALLREMNERRSETERPGADPRLIFFEDAGQGIAMAAAAGDSVEVIDRERMARKLGVGKSLFGLAGAGGVLESLWPRARGYNLLSMGMEEKKKVPVAVTIVLVALLLVLLVPYALLPLEREQRRLAEIERQIAARKEEVKRVEALKKEIEALSGEIDQIRAFKEARPTVLTVMKELTAVLPKNAWLTRSRVTDETVEIEGYAQSATEILPKLEQSTYFKKAEFPSPTIRDTRLNADRFVIKMEQEGLAKKQPEKPKDDRKK
jgi:Tfp pilus assembly protein PilN